MSDIENKGDTKQEQESKVISFDKSKKSTRAKPKASALKVKFPGVTIGWVLGMIILVLIAISFVAGPAIQAVVGKRQAAMHVFGKFGKEEISYAPDSFFADQVQSFSDQYKDSGTDPSQLSYQIWKSAYDTTVLFTAIGQLAKQAGIITSEDSISRAIIDGGYYNKDGVFDRDTYNKASTEMKHRVEQQVRRGYGYQTVMNDLQSIISSDAETAYVAEMARKGRTFSYLNLGPSRYPNDLAVQYAMENPQLFTEVDISIISLSDEEQAQSLAHAIISGTTSFENAAMENSLDSFAINGGKVGAVPYYTLSPNFKNPDDALKILEAENGQVLGPYESQGAWTIYRIDAKAAGPDYTDERALASIKTYIAMNESSLIEPYLEELANRLAAEARENGLEQTALDADIELVSVSATPYNEGQSTYLAHFSFTDPKGHLEKVAAMPEVARQLYESEEHTLLDPIHVDSSYLVVEIGEDQDDEGMGSYTAMFYTYLSGNQNQQDFSQILYTSDLHQNDFMSTYLKLIYGF
jgi:peptidyl-prolyl cis-trans isomerase D